LAAIIVVIHFFFFFFQSTYLLVTQLLFTAEDGPLAQRLIALYFSLFQAHVAQVAKEKVDKQEAAVVKRKELLAKLRQIKSQGADQGMCVNVWRKIVLCVGLFWISIPHEVF
jgi:hypothetical protein